MEISWTRPELLAYTAGIIDGEGYVGVKRWISSNHPVYEPWLSIGQSERRWLLLDFLNDHFPGGGVFGPYAKAGRRSPMKLLHWRRDAACHVLDELRGFLLLKGGQADLVLQLHEAMQHRIWGGHIHWNDALRIVGKDLHEKCCWLNRVGDDEKMGRSLDPTPLAAAEPGLFDTLG